MSRLPLFCLPYAGGVAQNIYARWQTLLPAHLQVLPLELAGHGRRMPEPFADDMAEAAQDICRQIAAALHGRKLWALYGHSMGALLAAEVLAQVNAAGLPAPHTCFLSGRNPPHAPLSRAPIHDLPQAEFLERIRALGGTPQQFFEIPELVEIFLPVLRSDYRLVETWAGRASHHCSPARLVFFQSDADPLLNPVLLPEWQQYSSQPLQIEHFAGDHFFLQPQAAQLCARIAAHLPAA